MRDNPFNLMSPKRCVALTKSGDRCKIRGNLTQEGLCFRHSKLVQRHNAAALQKRDSKSTFEKVERGAKIAGATAGGVWSLIQIVEWVVTHWPAIEHFFYTLDGHLMSFQELKSRVQSGSISPYIFAMQVERWYSRLPNSVRMQTERQFGDVRL